MADLRIGTTVYAAYARVATDWKNIGIFALIGAGILFGLEAIQTHLIHSGQGTSYFWYLLVDTMIVFYLHRLILLDSPSTTWSKLKAMKPELDGMKVLFGKFILFFGGFYLVLMLFLILAVTLSGGGLSGTSILMITLIVLGLAAVFTRISFVFPALAIQEESSLAQAWKETRGNGLRLYAIYACQVIPFYALGIGFAYAVKTIVPEESATVDFILSFVGYFLRYVGLAVLVAMISLSYRTVVLGEPEETAAVFD